MAEAPKKTREELRAARAERRAKFAAALEAHEDLCDELEDRFETQLGRRGVAWDMINDGKDLDETGQPYEAVPEWGPIAVKLGEPVTFKSFQSKSGAAIEDCGAFVLPAVIYPSKEVWNGLATERGALVFRLTKALMGLHGVKKESFRTKS